MAVEETILVKLIDSGRVVLGARLRRGAMGMNVDIVADWG